MMNKEEYDDIKQKIELLDYRLSRLELETEVAKIKRILLLSQLNGSAPRYKCDEVEIVGWNGLMDYLERLEEELKEF